MQWIEQNKVILNSLSALSALAAVGVLLVFRSNQGIELEPWQLGLVILPWLLLTMSFLPLLYLSWFRRPTTRWLFVKKSFFWLFTAGMLGIFMTIYGIVFGAMADSRP